MSSDVNLPSLWQPRGELRSAAMSQPQGFLTKAIANQAYNDLKTRLRVSDAELALLDQDDDSPSAQDTLMKRPKNSNLLAGGEFLPEMTRAHSPGQEMDTPVFDKGFVSRYEDA